MRCCTASTTGKAGRAAARRASSPAWRWDRRGGRSAPALLQLRASLSPDPLMGRRGYPLLLASGETADGVDAAGRPPASARSLHGAVGELQPAPLRPVEPVRLCRPARRARLRPAALHAPAVGHRIRPKRRSAITGSIRPISASACVTAGLVVGDVKLEGVALQRPRARPAPLRHRDRAAQFDRPAPVLEPGADAVAAGELGAAERAPSSSSRARTRPAGRRARIYNQPLGRRARWSTTLAWGRRSSGHGPLDAFVLESAVDAGRAGPCSAAPSGPRMTSSARGRPSRARPSASARCRWGRCTISGSAPHVRLGARRPVGVQLRSRRRSSPPMRETGDGAMVFLRVAID